MGQLIFRNKQTNVLIKTTRNNIKFNQIALKGDTGVGVASVYVDANNDFIITYTDGRVENAGRIQEHDPNMPILHQELFQGQSGQETITLSNNSTGIVILTLNGVQQRNTVDYNIIDNVVYFTEPLDQDDQIIVNYSVPLASIDVHTKKLIVDNIQDGLYNVGIMRLLLSNYEVKTFSGTVIMKDKENLGNIGSWKIEGCISKFDTNSSIGFVGQPTINVLGITQAAQNNGFQLFVEADQTNGALQIRTVNNGSFSSKSMATLILNEFV